MVPVTGSCEGGGLICVMNVLNKDGRRLCREVMHRLAAPLPVETGFEQQCLWPGPVERDPA